jgi:hypothetical protein
MKSPRAPATTVKTAKRPTKRAKGKRERFSWKTAALKLAKCVVLTIQSNGKIGVGSGQVMYRDAAGKMHIQRWDKDFVEALAYIGIEVVDKPKSKARRSKYDDPPPAIAARAGKGGE